MAQRQLINVRKIGIPAVAMLAFLGFWELVIRFFSISPVILPGPFSVVKALVLHIGYLALHGGITLLEAVLGFLLGGVVAILMAVIFHFSQSLKQALYPYAIGIKAIPLVALAPIVVVWFGSGMFSKVVMAAIISFFPILVTAAQGLNSVEPEALDLMATLSASKWQVLAKLRFPNALPYLFAGMRVSSTFAVVGAVVAEFVSSQNGIGYVVKSSSYYLDTDLTFAATTVAALTGLAFFGLVTVLEHKLVFWRPKGQEERSELLLGRDSR